jgi:hypothetical protein
MMGSAVEGVNLNCLHTVEHVLKRKDWYELRSHDKSLEYLCVWATKPMRQSLVCYKQDTLQAQK